MIKKEVRVIKRLISILIILSVFLTGCGAANVDNTSEYNGEELHIGIIGDIPEVRETQIEFQEIAFDFLSVGDFDTKYDAIFITRDNLSEAANAEYAPIYKNSRIPFYFIESNKSYIAFVEENLSYEDEPDTKNGVYITGILYIENKTWGYNLYDDIKSVSNIKSVYSRVFETISQIKNNKLP